MMLNLFIQIEQQTTTTTCWWEEEENTQQLQLQQQQQQQQQHLLFQSPSDCTGRVLSTSTNRNNNSNNNNIYIPRIVPPFVVASSSLSSSNLSILYSNRNVSWIILVITIIIFTIVCIILYLWRKRNNTYQRLVNAGLPTIFWIPKFYNYIDTDIDIAVVNNQQTQQRKHHEQLSSKSITNILQRMEQYNGPYDMYGTVYGLSTPVIHIAHPIPALAILSLSSSVLLSSVQKTKSISISISTATSKLSNTTTNNLFISSSAVTKQPAYNHFKNFCGNGVFTADGYDWKMKRIAVTHALLRSSSIPIPMTNAASTSTASCTNSDNNKIVQNNTTTTNTKQRPIGQGGMIGGGYQLKTEQEANYAATKLLLELQNKMNTTVIITPQTKVDANDGCHFNNNNTYELSTTYNAFNIVPILQNTTIGIIYRYITHTDLPSSTSTTSRDNNSTEYNTVQNQNQTLVSLYLQSIVRIRMIILAQSRSIWFLLPRWMYHMFSSMYIQEEITMIPIRQLAHQACIDATCTTNASSPLAQLQNNYFDLYNNNNNNCSPTTKVENIQQQKFSKNLIDEAITLLFAGQDTTAATLSWTIHLLSIYPDIQMKLANEIRQVFSNNENQNDTNENTTGSNTETNNVYVTKQMISKMTYLDAVIKESMRLYPVAPFVVRKLTNPIHLPPDNDSSNGTTTTGKTTTKEIILPSESMACIWIYSLHRNKKFWNKPDDFIPERWLRQSNNTTASTSASAATTVEDAGIRNGAYMPFAAGPRNCIGQPLAQIILRVLLSQLVNRYEFRDPRLVSICNNNNTNNDKCSTNSKNDNKCSSVGDGNDDYYMMKNLPSIDDRFKLRIDMQAGFTVLPKGGVSVTIHERC